MSIHRVAFLLSLSVLAELAACSPNLEPDHYPRGTKVTLTMREVSPEPFRLGPQSSQLFLDMLANQPIHTRISAMRALPMGVFTVAGTDYLWHGNAVIRGKGRAERLWYGPYVQRLIAVIMSEDHGSRETVQRILDNLEGDPTVPSTPLEGPGAYPGGGDALHPGTSGRSDRSPSIGATDRQAMNVRAERPSNRMNPAAGGGLAVAVQRPRSPAAGYAER